MIDKETAAKIAEILVVECGASASMLRDLGFERYVTTPSNFSIEFRFQGALAFGGKFNADQRGERWRVTCYSEHETPARRQMIARANERLAQLEREMRVT
jgi:hypothetical protein